MTSALKYVMAQYKNFLRDQENRNKDIYDPLNGFFCSPQEDFFKWNFTLIGMLNTPFEGSILYGQIIFPSTFPVDPPKIKFNNIYHPNIGPDGFLCMSTLHDQRTDNFYDKADEKWNPANTIESIIISMMLILQEPNNESPANIDAAKDFRENKLNYFRKFRRLLNQ